VVLSKLVLVYAECEFFIFIMVKSCPQFMRSVLNFASDMLGTETLVDHIL
jgi:hypothetical protein